MIIKYEYKVVYKNTGQVLNCECPAMQSHRIIFYLTNHKLPGTNTEVSTLVTKIKFNKHAKHIVIKKINDYYHA